MQTRELFNYDLKYSPLIVAGTDEAGRGPLAGPVVCAVCVMPPDCFIDKINDSKILTEKTREDLYEKIISSALDYGVCALDNHIIDSINILAATKLAMKKAVESLKKVKPDILLVDAVTNLDIGLKYEPIINGDALSYNIAAASIIAKVHRDRLMKEYALLYPQYGFEKHKGYGTKEHIQMLKKFGKCEIHRDTFIKNFVGEILEKSV